MKDRQRITVIQNVSKGRMPVEEAARLLDRCERTIYRMEEALLKHGVDGLVHGNRGRPSPRRIPDARREEILKLAQNQFSDVNDTHMRELLSQRKKICLGRETLRGILRQGGVKPKRRRRSPKYRSRRERKAALGMMLQIDGSVHDWLEGRGPLLTLVAAIDDATNRVWARFFKAETTWAYLELLEDIITTHGIPLSLYSDHHSVFYINREPTIVEQLTGTESLTQFGRAMQELSVHLIPAGSPQAKGRVERLWGTFQDRLIVELRLAGITTLEQANAFLPNFLVAHNARFAVAPREARPVFRKAPPLAKLRRILCLKDTRVVKKDHTLSFEGVVWQIPPSKAFRSIAGRKVQVLQLRDGSLEILHRGRAVANFSPQAISRMLRKNPQLKTNLRAA